MATPRHHGIWIFANVRQAAGVGLAIAIMFGLTVVITQTAQAQTFNVIHNFTGGGDGKRPRAGLTRHGAGDFYGTTNHGGAHDYGTVFNLAHRGSGWILTPLYSFSGGDDGYYLDARVIIGPDGNLYGTTAYGGGGPCTGPPPGCGTIFRLRPTAGVPHSVLASWTETPLHRFTGPPNDGNYPGFCDLVFDPTGNIYGTTQGGGLYDWGTVFKLTQSNGGWVESVLYSFTSGADGGSPTAGGVVFDNAGNLYGTAFVGGDNNSGVVYELTPSGSGWTENVLYDFQVASDGGNPIAGLIFDHSGNLYGATTYGGSGGGGTVFELTPSNGNWIYTVLYTFSGAAGPEANLIMDANGNLYGTTFADGAYGYGNVFKLTPSNGNWTYTDLYDFTGGNDGANPESSVSFDASDNLYGTAEYGGAYGNGVVWEITP